MKPDIAPEVRSTGASAAVLAAGDAAVFVVFTVIGLFSHGDSFTPYHLLRNIIPLELSWFLVAVIVETYQHPGWARPAINWLVGVSAAIVVRKWWVGSPDGAKFWTFMAVALVTNGLFLVIWRLAASRLRTKAA